MFGVNALPTPPLHRNLVSKQFKKEEKHTVPVMSTPVSMGYDTHMSQLPAGRTYSRLRGSPPQSDPWNRRKIGDLRRGAGGS